MIDELKPDGWYVGYEAYMNGLEVCPANVCFSEWADGWNAAMAEVEEAGETDRDERH